MREGGVAGTVLEADRVWRRLFDFPSRSPTADVVFDSAVLCAALPLSHTRAPLQQAERSIRCVQHHHQRVSRCPCPRCRQDDAQIRCVVDAEDVRRVLSDLLHGHLFRGPGM